MQGGAIGVPGGLCCGLEETFDESQTFNLWADPGGGAGGAGRLPPAPGEDGRQRDKRRADHARIHGPAGGRRDDAGGALRPCRRIPSHPQAAIAAGFEVAWWDPLATVALVDRDVIDFEVKRVGVVQSGPSAGRHDRDIAARQGRWLHFAMTADQGAFEDLFLEGLNMSLPRNSVRRAVSP
jgi:hypothetical protein